MSQSKEGECRKRIIINRSGFNWSTFKRQHKWFGLLWVTIHWQGIEGSYRHFDSLVEEGKRKGYEIIYK